MSRVRKLATEVRKLTAEAIQGRHRVPISVGFRGQRRVVANGDFWVFLGMFTIAADGHSTTDKVKVTVDARSTPPTITSLVVNQKEMSGTVVEGLFRSWMLGHPDATTPPVF